MKCHQAVASYDINQEIDKGDFKINESFKLYKLVYDICYIVDWMKL